jgi:hypothetical protein
VTRPPLDRIPQSRLTNELRVAIDRAMYAVDTPQKRASLRVLRRLIEENPRSYVSAHVQHNLGRARRAWLAQAGFHVDTSHHSFRRHGRFGQEADDEIRALVRESIGRARSLQGIS